MKKVHIQNELIELFKLNSERTPTCSIFCSTQ